MVQSITEYVSYFEAGEDMTDAEYGIYMRAIHKFAYLDIEPDYSSLPPLVKAALRTVIASIRKNKEDRINGSKGGAKTGNQNARKKQPVEELQNNPPCFLETTNEKGNDNENVNDNDKERDKGGQCFSLSQSQQEKMALINPNNKADYAKPIFDILEEAGLPCCNKNFPNFLCRDWMNAVRMLNSPVLKGLHSDEVIGALKNYVLVINHPNVWSGWKNKKSFDVFVAWEHFKDFLPDRFCLDNFLDRSIKPKQTQGGVGMDRVMQMIDEEVK